MDEFDKKREVVASLMKMLGTNANDEVSKSMAPAASVEKISVSPEAEKMVHPDAEMHGDSMPMEDEMHDDMPKPEGDEMYALTGHADGGMVEAPKEDCSIEEQDMENNSSTPFESLMKRAKRMK